MVPPRRLHQRPADDREHHGAGGEADPAEPFDPSRRLTADAVHEMAGRRLPDLRRRGDDEADADDADGNFAEAPVERRVDGGAGLRFGSRAVLQAQREA